MPQMSAAVLIPSPPAQRDPLARFLLFSLLLHLLLLLLWPQFKRATAPPQEQLTAVELLPPEAFIPPQVAQVPPQVQEPEPAEEPPKEEQQPPPAVPEQQIVSVPDEVNDQVPDKTRFLSDRNTTVKEQTVAVGTPLTKPPEEKNQPTPDKADAVTQKEPTQLALNTPGRSRKPPVDNPLEEALKDTKHKRSPLQGDPKARRAKPQLFARPDDVLAKGWLSTDGEAEDEEEAQRTPPSGNELLAMAPPPARENFLTMPGPRGTLDFLPDVRKGNLTFLNTKASRFAPFVRRVAQRVFQHLLIRQRRNLQVDDVVAARNYVQLQAKLDDKGILRGVTLHTRSGSYAVDESLLDACQQGAWDENPPPEAKSEDGFYHFIFRSRINARFDATGLRGILTFLEVGLV